jgi:hypothetical protein
MTFSIEFYFVTFLEVNMLKILCVLSILASFHLQASDYCLTDGDCQSKDVATTGFRCFIVRTGIDNQDRDVCSKRCYEVALGSKCRLFSNEVFGVCKKETSMSPDFDPTKPECHRYISTTDPLPF